MFESRFWKTQIKRDASYILKRLEINLNKLEDEKLDQVFSEVEIKLFAVMYSLRKLMDTKKFPDWVSGHKMNLSVFPRNNNKYMKPWSSFDDFYNLKKPKKDKLSLREICNQFIHAHFFQPVGNSRHVLRTIFFIADRHKEKCLYSINIKYLLKKIKKIVDEYPYSTTFIYNKEKNEWETTIK